MKKFLLLLLIPTVLHCNGKPKIEFETLTHDFGKQAQNAELKHIVALGIGSSTARAGEAGAKVASS